MTDNDREKMFHRCTACGGKLIERLPNGLLRFIFGRKGKKADGFVPINMLIHGSVKMRCFRRACRSENPRHYNVITLLPGMNVLQDDKKNKSNESTDKSKIRIDHDPKGLGKEV